MPVQSLAGGQQCSPALFPWPANPSAASSVPLPQVPASGGAPAAGQDGLQQGQQHAAGVHRILRSNSAEVRIRGLGPASNGKASACAGALLLLEFWLWLGIQETHLFT